MYQYYDMEKPKLLFSVTRDDLVMQTFTVSGHGGGGKDTSNNGVRLTHPPSKATATCTQHRSMSKNRKGAFAKLVATPQFLNWHKLECAKRLHKQPPISEAELQRIVNAAVDIQMAEDKLLIEVLAE